MKTVYDTDLPGKLVKNYCDDLVNKFYKILPMRENKEETLQVYMESLMFELVGARNVVYALQNNSAYLSLISILQSLIDDPENELHVVKREVFHAISICNKLKDRYGYREIRH